MAYESFDNINQHELQAVIEAYMNISPHGDTILKKLKIRLNACIILLLLLYSTRVIFSVNFKF